MRSLNDDTKAKEILVKADTGLPADHNQTNGSAITPAVSTTLSLELSSSFFSTLHCPWWLLLDERQSMAGLLGNPLHQDKGLLFDGDDTEALQAVPWS